MSKLSFNALVIALASLPVIGIGMAFYTGSLAWLFLLFALALFM